MCAKLQVDSGEKFWCALESKGTTDNKMHRHAHTYTHTHINTQPANLVDMYMCVRLMAWGWVTYWGLISEKTVSHLAAANCL